jgi:hypothetical protein
MEPAPPRSITCCPTPLASAASTRHWCSADTNEGASRGATPSHRARGRWLTRRANRSRLLEPLLRYTRSAARRQIDRSLTAWSLVSGERSAHRVACGVQIGCKTCGAARNWWRSSRPRAMKARPSASCSMIWDTSTWSRKPCNPSTTRRHEVVTHVLGTFWYPCVRAGQTPVWRAMPNDDEHYVYAIAL